MISDVLSDAVSRIEEYQKDLPNVYNEYRDEVEHVKSEMQKLQQKFDAPPRNGLRSI